MNELKPQYALSLQQPYAELIVQRADPADPHKCLKPWENRSKKLPEFIRRQLPVRIYVHASLTWYDVQLHEVFEIMTREQYVRTEATLVHMYHMNGWLKGKNDRRQATGYFGCIVGEVTITGQWLKDSPPSMLEAIAAPPEWVGSPWFFGPWGYSLRDPVKYERPIPKKGALGFWPCDLETHVKVLYDHAFVGGSMDAHPEWCDVCGEEHKIVSHPN
jgi:hypothetical protein